MGELEESVEELERRADAAESGEEAAALLREAAAICEEQVGDLERAMGLYEQAVELEPADIEAHHGLERIATYTENWTLLLEVLERQVDVVEDSARKVDVLLRMGMIYEEMLADIQRARETYRQVLAVDPGNAVARQWLERTSELPPVPRPIDDAAHREAMEQASRGSAFRGVVPGTPAAGDEPETEKPPVVVAAEPRRSWTAIVVVVLLVSMAALAWLMWGR